MDEKFQIMYTDCKSYEWMYVTLTDLKTLEPKALPYKYNGKRNIIWHMVNLYPESYAIVVYKKRGKKYVIDRKVFYKLEDWLCIECITS